MSEENVDGLPCAQSRRTFSRNRLTQGRKMTKHKGFIVVCLEFSFSPRLARLPPLARRPAPTAPSTEAFREPSLARSARWWRGEGTGNLSHLGKVSMVWEGFNSFQGVPNTVSLGGATTFVSASGDELTGLFVGQAVANGAITLTVLITGGTGRFEDVSGTLTVAGSNAVSFISVNFTGTFEFQFAGQITY